VCVCALHIITCTYSLVHLSPVWLYPASHFCIVWLLVWYTIQSILSNAIIWTISFIFKVFLLLFQELIRTISTVFSLLMHHWRLGLGVDLHRLFLKYGMFLIKSHRINSYKIEKSKSWVSVAIYCLAFTVNILIMVCCNIMERRSFSGGIIAAAAVSFVVCDFFTLTFLLVWT